MRLNFYPYTLELKHAFTISYSSRTSTPVVLTEIEHEGFVGYGEAALPPHFGVTQNDVIDFLKLVNLEQYKSPLNIDDILDYVDNLAEGNNAAKASIDIALHDLAGKINNQSVRSLYELQGDYTPKISYTIGISSNEELKLKLTEAGEYKVLKVKLGTENDKEIIKNIRKLTDKPIIADANQGWHDHHDALELCIWLYENNVLLIEQPFDKNDMKKTSWLMKKSPIPVIADEAIWRLPDIKKVADVYSGINIKLMKSTGIREAYKMIKYAHEKGLDVMLGCMTETSCGITAAAQLSPMVRWADLDGNLLISNDVFTQLDIKEGRIMLNNKPGLGIEKL